MFIVFMWNTLTLLFASFNDLFLWLIDTRKTKELQGSSPPLPDSDKTTQAQYDDAKFLLKKLVKALRLPETRNYNRHDFSYFTQSLMEQVDSAYDNSLQSKRDGVAITIARDNSIAAMTLSMLPNLETNPAIED
eukprot:NODE_4666_length_637_cov_118.353741_g4007_i0.p1 GENE.NODE_4666_length_637_cov_118.353741_g4007_i0~~NODE_4666_length_637_cov_118.353741_g4007_i0.p1  ORF type:complete len:134 (-),score=38.78 NODE_4666_length_637_cov_118.353741_g4007_i0:88-489(-)